MFDHAIRCRLSKPETKKEWRRARRFASDRAHQAHHLGRALGESGKVWIMGWLALDAVTHLTALPRQAVAAGVIPARPLEGKFFVSRYLLHASQAEMDAILDGFRAFVAV